MTPEQFNKLPFEQRKEILFSEGHFLNNVRNRKKDVCKYELLQLKLKVIGVWNKQSELIDLTASA